MAIVDEKWCFSIFGRRGVGALSEIFGSDPRFGVPLRAAPRLILVFGSWRYAHEKFLSALVQGF